MLRIKKTSVMRLFFLIYLFLYVFDVYIFPIAMTNILFVLGVLIIVVKSIKSGKFTVPYEILNILKPFIPFWIYFLVLTVIHCFLDVKNMNIFVEEVFDMIKNFARIIVSCYVVYLYYCGGNNEENRSNYFNDLVIIGIIQTICVLAAFLFPTIRQTFNNFTINNSGNAHIISYIQTNANRCYGLAGNLFDSFGYITAMLIMIVFIRAVDENKKFFTIFLPMLLMPFLNARTGIVLVAIGCVLALLFYVDKIVFKKFFSYFGIIIVLVIVCVLGYNIIPENTKLWIEKGIDSIQALIFSREYVSTFATLNRMMIIPDDFIWGMGASPERLMKGASDIGYIQGLWRFGLIGTVLLLGGFCVLFINCFMNTKNKGIKCFVMCITVFFFVYFYKIYSIGNAGANLIIFSLVLILFHNKREQKQLEKS